MTKFDPQKHRRRSIRLKGYDYTAPGAYFITLVAWQREEIFGEIVDGEIKLNKFGQIAKQQWGKLPRRFRYIELDEFVVMPNHVHGIIVISADRRARRVMSTTMMLNRPAVPLPNGFANRYRVPSQPLCVRINPRLRIVSTPYATHVESPYGSEITMNILFGMNVNGILLTSTLLIIHSTGKTMTNIQQKDNS